MKKLKGNVVDKNQIRYKSKNDFHIKSGNGSNQKFNQRNSLVVWCFSCANFNHSKKKMVIKWCLFQSEILLNTIVKYCYIKEVVLYNITELQHYKTNNCEVFALVDNRSKINIMSFYIVDYDDLFLFWKKKIQQTKFFWIMSNWINLSLSFINNPNMNNDIRRLVVNYQPYSKVVWNWWTNSSTTYTTCNFEFASVQRQVLEWLDENVIYVSTSHSHNIVFSMSLSRRIHNNLQLLFHPLDLWGNSFTAFEE